MATLPDECLSETREFLVEDLPNRANLAVIELSEQGRRLLVREMRLPSEILVDRNPNRRVVADAGVLIEHAGREHRVAHEVGRHPLGLSKERGERALVDPP